MSGLEPPTPTLSGWCSNRLSYISIWFVLTSLATLVGLLKVVKFTLSGWCSNRLSYISIWFVLTSLATLVGVLKVVKSTLSGWCSNLLSYISSSQLSLLLNCSHASQFAFLLGCSSLTRTSSRENFIKCECLVENISCEI